MRRLVLAVVAWGSLSAPWCKADPPDSSDLPAGLSAPCNPAAVTTVPLPFDHFMRLQCTIHGQVLAPPQGFAWVFTNGIAMDLSALSPHSKKTGPDAYFTKLEVAPLSGSEDVAFRRRVQSILADPSGVKGDLLRLELDTSTGEHRQEYLFINRDSQNRIERMWGIECFNDCDPMDKQPWAWQVVMVRAGAAQANGTGTGAP